MIVIPVNLSFLFGVAAICAVAFALLWLVDLPAALGRAGMRREQRRRREAGARRLVEESRIRSGYYRNRKPQDEEAR